MIEASSHGLHQKRLNHINLKAAIFTNFSQDHLDYHKTMRLYLNSKLLLFKKILSKKKTMIVDKSIKEFSILKKISKKKRSTFSRYQLNKKKLKNKKNLKLNEFQLKNLSMAIAAAKLCNLKEKKYFALYQILKTLMADLSLSKLLQII